MQWLDEHYDLHPLGEGMQNRVFEIEGQPWVLKEGRWDLDIPVHKHVSVPVHAEFIERMLRPFSFRFLPTPEQALAQQEHYMLFQSYLGYADQHDPIFLHPEGEHIVSLQKKRRDDLLKDIHVVEDRLPRALTPFVREALHSEYAHHNFLPKEYLLYGTSLSKKNKQRKTFFVVQERLEGTTLHDMPLSKLAHEQKMQLAVLLYLLVLFREETGIVPDTRPRFPLLQAYDWLTKTDNILFTESGLKFIDTRWFWNEKHGWVSGGLFLPHLTMHNTRNLLTKLQ